LITDAMCVLDPHLPDGPYAWRDGRRFVKDGDRLYVEGTDTLAGRCVSFSHFPNTPTTDPFDPQRGDPGRVRAQLRALHGLRARARAPLRDAPPRAVPRPRGHEGHASRGRGRGPRRIRARRTVLQT
jgi:hypothetical protein